MARAFTWQVKVVDANGRFVTAVFDGFELTAKSVFDRVMRDGLARRPEGVEPLELQLRDPGDRIRRREQLQPVRTDVEIAGVRTHRIEVAS